MIKKNKKVWIIISLILSILYIVLISYFFFFERYVTNPFYEHKKIIVTYTNHENNSLNQSFSITDQEILKSIFQTFPMIHLPQFSNDQNDCSDNEYYQVITSSINIYFNPTACSTKNMVNGSLRKSRGPYINTKILIPKDFANKIIEIVKNKNNNT